VIQDIVPSVIIQNSCLIPDPDPNRMYGYFMYRMRILRTFHIAVDF
jgi:hypothetical protein